MPRSVGGQPVDPVLPRCRSVLPSMPLWDGITADGEGLKFPGKEPTCPRGSRLPTGTPRAPDARKSGVTDQRERGSRCPPRSAGRAVDLPGGPVRASGHSRYRQWATHKLGTWYDQFGSSGCVGCGRCIVWCPVGIDITEEAHALNEERTAGAAQGEAPS